MNIASQLFTLVVPNNLITCDVLLISYHIYSIFQSDLPMANKGSSGLVLVFHKLLELGVR